MRLSVIFTFAGTFLAAAVLSVVAARFAVTADRGQRRSGRCAPRWTTPG